MGSDPDREPPFFFCKPADAVVAAQAASGLVLPFPSATANLPATANLHYEVEQARGLCPRSAGRVPERSHACARAPLAADAHRRWLRSAAAGLTSPSKTPWRAYLATAWESTSRGAICRRGRGANACGIRRALAPPPAGAQFCAFCSRRGHAGRWRCAVSCSADAASPFRMRRSALSARGTCQRHDSETQYTALERFPAAE